MSTLRALRAFLWLVSVVLADLTCIAKVLGGLRPRGPQSAPGLEIMSPDS